MAWNPDEQQELVTGLGRLTLILAVLLAGFAVVGCGEKPVDSKQDNSSQDQAKSPDMQGT